LRPRSILWRTLLVPVVLLEEVCVVFRAHRVSTE
jgi:hypothetical protein